MRVAMLLIFLHIFNFCTGALDDWVNLAQMPVVSGQFPARWTVAVSMEFLVRRYIRFTLRV